jgi:hypothetical protein
MTYERSREYTALVYTERKCEKEGDLLSELPEVLRAARVCMRCLGFEPLEDQVSRVPLCEIWHCYYESLAYGCG